MTVDIINYIYLNFIISGKALLYGNKHDIAIYRYFLHIIAHT